MHRPEDIPPEELYWIAGLLEGEGSFLPGPPSQPHLPVLQIAMPTRTSWSESARCSDASWCGSRPRKVHWNVAWTLRLVGARAVAWMEALRPVMGVRRRAQIDRAIASFAPRDRTLLQRQDAIEALALLEAGEPVKRVAECFGTSVWCIYDLRLGRTHRELDRTRLPRRR